MISAMRGFIRTHAEKARASFSGYAVAVLVPLIAVVVGTRLGMPAFVFEHLTVLFVVAVAIQWGMRPALVAAVAASLGDNLLLREPIGRPAVSGLRDVLDLILFVVVAATVGWLVASARREKVRAQLAADLERRTREERDRLVMTISHDLATPLAAIRGTSPGGGAVEVTLRLEGEHALVRVRDSGMGISAAARPRIFERAFRAPEAEATAPGLGLGLNIAAEIVQRHGGTIDLRAALPNATSVLVRLPATSAADGVEERARNIETAPLTDSLSHNVDGRGSASAAV